MDNVGLTIVGSGVVGLSIPAKLVEIEKAAGEVLSLPIATFQATHHTGFIVERNNTFIDG